MFYQRLRTRAAHLALKASEFLYPKGQARVVQRKVAGSWLLLLANEDVGRQIAVLGSFERADSMALASLIRRNDICVDVGANVGYYTMLMARHAPDGSVTAFDPLSRNYGLVLASTALNGYPNVKVICSAVGDRDGTVEFVEAVDGAYSSLFDTGRVSASRRIQVPICALDSHWRSTGRDRIDVVKIDVEGAERLVVDGARELLASEARPRVIMIELCDENLRPFGASVSAIVERLAALGYSSWVADVKGLRPMRDADVNRLFNVFFLRSDAVATVPGRDA